MRQLAAIFVIVLIGATVFLLASPDRRETVSRASRIAYYMTREAIDEDYVHPPEPSPVSRDASRFSRFVSPPSAAPARLSYEKRPDEDPSKYEFRMRLVRMLEEWCEKKAITSEQKAALLRGLADAQINYAASSYARFLLHSQLTRMQEKRQTPEQRARLARATTLAEVSKANREIDEENGITPEEKAILDEWWMRRQGEDLVVEMLAGLEGVLSEEQIASFRHHFVDFHYFKDLLTNNIAVVDGEPLPFHDNL